MDSERRAKDYTWTQHVSDIKYHRTDLIEGVNSIIMFYVHVGSQLHYFIPVGIITRPFLLLMLLSFVCKKNDLHALHLIIHAMATELLQLHTPKTGRVILWLDVLTVVFVMKYYQPCLVSVFS